MIDFSRLSRIRPRRFWVIHFRSETLFPAGISWLGKRTADVARDNAAGIVQLSQRPLKIGNREAAAFPICYCLGRAQTVEIDRDINLGSAKIVHE